jgi:hypothetical protein
VQKYRGENTGNRGSSCKNLGCTAVFSVSTAVFLDGGFDRFLKPNKRSDFRGLLKLRFFSKETAVNRGFSENFFPWVVLPYC